MHSLFASSLLLSSVLTSTLALPTTSKAPKPRYVAPLHQKTRLVRRYTGTAEADVPYNYETAWMTTVTIGGYTGNLLIDTGSADLWVLGATAANPNNQPVYTPADNNAYPGESFDAHYMTGPQDFATGIAVLDSVTIANLQIPRMAIGVAAQIGTDEVGQPWDGILGLGFQTQNSIKPDQSSTFMELAMGELDAPIFAVDLKSDGSGTLEFGAVDQAAYQGDLVGAPINVETGTWIVDGVSYTVGDTSFAQQMNFDTGATSTWVDFAVAQAYWTQVEGAVDTAGDGSVFTHPCDAALPDFSFYVNGNLLTIPGYLLTGFDTGKNDGICTARIRGTEGPATIGSAFFLAYYVVYNQADPSISFAPQA